MIKFSVGCKGDREEKIFGCTGTVRSHGEGFIIRNIEEYIRNLPQLEVEKNGIISFIKRFRMVYLKIRKIVESGDSDAIDKTRLYQEMENLNETILLSSLTIDRRRMHKRLSVMGKNALFTNIYDMKPEAQMVLYRQRNRVEHYFSIISMRGLASHVDYWAPQKIRVHMFFSYPAYLFLALMRMKIKPVKELYLTRVPEVLTTITILHASMGQEVTRSLYSADEGGKLIMENLNIIQTA